MFKNFIKTAFRNIFNNLFYSGINILGLAVGIICSILIMLFIQDELSFDKHHLKHKRIYRLESHYSISGSNDKFAITSLPIAPTLMDEFPEIENYTRFQVLEGRLFKYEDKEFFEDSVGICDSTAFDIFTYDFSFGSGQNALNRPYTMVITESMSKKYFGAENPIGKVIQSGGLGDYTVTAVIKNPPGNQHLKFNCLISVATFVELLGVERFNDRSAGAFWNVNVFSYILLKENTSIDQIIEKFPGFYEKYMKSIGDQINGSFNLMATSLEDIHFASNELRSDRPVGDISYVYVFGFVGIFIMLIACINYMNMSSARSANRAREVGVRKVIGAHRSTLIKQFLGESLIMSFLALIIALIAIYLILPSFNELADKKLFFSDLGQGQFIIGILIITIFVGLISGSYPALYLSSFMPVKVLKGQEIPGSARGILRKILVVFQFAISIIMIAGTLIVTQQQKFIKNMDLGFNRDNIVIISNRDTTFTRNISSFREELLDYNNIISIATASSTMGNDQGIMVFSVEQEGEMVEKTLNLISIDYDFIDMLDLELKEGRNYERDRGTDNSKAIIINETAANDLGWGENALGKKIQLRGRQDGVFRIDAEVIGVLKDFQYGSIKNKIAPFVLLLNFAPSNVIYINTTGNDPAETMAHIKKTYEGFDPAWPFDSEYLDDHINKQYVAEQKLNIIFTVFSILTIFICCLGLLGLSSFVIEQRTREIGIRKVLGSSNSNILIIVSKGFLFLVLAANIIAIPVVFIFMDKWLQSFHYRIELGPLPFILAALIALIIAILTIGYHSLKASNSNIVDALKHE
ncbi:ABC transporter permease [Bacteroidota bacterium]